MNKPPDNGGTNDPPVDRDKLKPPDITSPGPKYLVISRTNDSKSLINVSPFLIKKVVDCTCGGEVSECKKLRNGTILVKTKNINQAKKLIQLTSLCPNIDVEVSWHNSLNFVKGVLYSNDLRGIPEEEILYELKNQNVFKIEKIKRKVNNEMEETGLVIITFETTTLPEELNIGYERVKIRSYIPLPLRCKDCLRYGHIAKICKNSKTCPNCAQNFHTNEKELCIEPKKCSNCKEFDSLDCNHSALDKKCPIFLKEREIQTIITLEKVNKTTANNLYKQRHPNTIISYSSVAKQTINNTQSPNTINNQQEKNKTNFQTTLNSFDQQNLLPGCSHHSTSNQRSIINYSNISDIEISEHEMEHMNTTTQITTTNIPKTVSEIETSENEIESTNKTINKNVIILPRATSKKNKQMLKQKTISGQRSKRARK